jgi:OOP family OmpA-OmpF porin
MSSGEAQLIDAGKLRLNILFDTEKATIRSESYPQLDEVGEILAKHSDIRVEVGGHTDTEGDEGYNQSLSQSRAEAVKAYWVSKFGIKADRLVAKGYGESDPASTNDTAQGRQQNRRVELTVLNPEVLR